MWTVPIRFPSRLTYVIAWLAFALGTILWLDGPQVDRAQEARVLETARQMLDAPTWDGWLLPQLNGEPRLRKPPLAYWYTAASYKLFGHVNETTGRLPTVLIAWLTIATTYALGRTLGDRRFAFFAAAAFASSFLFLRFARSAETDPPAMLGVALACLGLIRGHRGSLAWFHLAALGIAIAAMAKGGPAVFPLVFLVGLAIAERSWRPIVRFAVSGAPLVAVALIVPWFAYVAMSPSGKQVGQEVNVLLTGANHFGLFYDYLGPLLIGVLPWTGWFVLGLIVAWQTRRSPDDPRRLALLMIACVGLPLCVTLNVQAHYLLPMMPACALLVAWVVDRVLNETDDANARRLAGWTLYVAAAVLAIAVPAAVIVAAITRSRVAVDVATAGVALAMGVWLFARHRAAPPSAQLVATALAMLVTMPVLLGHWGPSLDPPGVRDLTPAAMAALRERFGNARPGPFATLGDDANIALAFYLREPITSLDGLDAAADFLAANPHGVIVFERSYKRPPATTMPATFAKIFEAPIHAEAAIQFFVSSSAENASPFIGASP